MFKSINVPKLIISVVICHTAGLIGSLFTDAGTSGWYDTLNKPALTPPDLAFPIVWSILYTLMGLSLYLIWNQGIKNPKVKSALIIFGIQLGFNILWTIIFFGTQSILGGLTVIILLWLFILITIFKFFPISKPAAWLLVPYSLWVIFAAYLNFSILLLNKPVY
jgi:tryptophan-rich sensory protein